MFMDQTILPMKVRGSIYLQPDLLTVRAATRQNQKREKKIFIPTHSKQLQHPNPDHKSYGNTLLSPAVEGTQILDFCPENIKMKIQTKPRFLCLHGFRTSADIMQKQLRKWPESISEKLDLVFINAPNPAQGKSDVGGFFDPPFYEWFEYDKGYKNYKYFDECLDYIEDHMLKLGPFDGLLGFSQGAFLSAALPGLQSKGAILANVPKIKFLIIIGGGKLLNPIVAEKAYASPIECPSVHFLGQRDYIRPHGNKLLNCFVDPVVIHHPMGHIIPTLDEKGVETMQRFLDNIKKTPSHGNEPTNNGEDLNKSLPTFKATVA